MSARLRAPARRPGAGHGARVLSLTALLSLLAVLTVHTVSATDPPPEARHLDAAEARREGVALDLLRHPEVRVPVLEVTPVDPAAARPRLLDISGTAGSVAVSEGLGREVETLVLAHADGSQLRVPVDGLMDATFSPNEAWLALVDGVGRLWHLRTADGAMQHLDDGPFLRVPLVEADGSILALAVPSVEAPFRSRLVRVSADGGSVEAISDEELVYAVQRLADGGLAVVAHRPGGTVVQRLEGRTASIVTDLGEDAVNVSVSADGAVIAWETAGQAFLRVAGQEPRHLGAGRAPLVSADGWGILLQQDERSVLVDPAGRQLVELSSAAGLLDCSGCGS
jgi:hypothetical protein